MEKYSQFRDRGGSRISTEAHTIESIADLQTGTGITPFFPVPPQPSGSRLMLHVFLFILRLPIFLTVTVGYFLILQWVPLGSLAKKALLWIILGVPGVWWVDLQIDGVKKG